MVVILKAVHEYMYMHEYTPCTCIYVLTRCKSVYFSVCRSQFHSKRMNASIKSSNRHPSERQPGLVTIKSFRWKIVLTTRNRYSTGNQPYVVIHTHGSYTYKFYTSFRMTLCIYRCSRLNSFNDAWPRLEKWYNKNGLVKYIDASLPEERLFPELEQILEDTITHVRFAFTSTSCLAEKHMMPNRGGEGADVFFC